MIVIVLTLGAEAQSAMLRGTVADQTGARVAGATVTITDASGSAHTAPSDQKGTFSFTKLAPGMYRVQAAAPAMSLEQPLSVILKAGAQNLDLVLLVQGTKQQIEVQSQAGPTISAESVNNASSIVLRGTDLQSLGD